MLLRSSSRKCEFVLLIINSKVLSVLSPIFIFWWVKSWPLILNTSSVVLLGSSLLLLLTVDQVMDLGLSRRYQILVQIFCPGFKTSKCFISLQNLSNTSELLFSKSDTCLQKTLGFFFVIVIIIFLFTIYSDSGKHLVYQNALVLIPSVLV